MQEVTTLNFNNNSAGRPLWNGLSQYDQEDYERPDTPLDMVIPSHIINNGGSTYTQADDRVIEWEDIDLPGVLNVNPGQAPLRVHRVTDSRRPG